MLQSGTPKSVQRTSVVALDEGDEEAVLIKTRVR